MSLHQIHVFISHSWSYSGHYDTLAKWVFDQNWRFGQAVADFRNYSVPRTDPILNAPNDKTLKEAIYRQIARSHVVVIPTGMYAHYSKWIGKEIEGAAFYGKPVLAVNLRGAQRTSSVVGRSADEFVAWNSASVVTGIWNLYCR
ncbi:TIR domain-containing protein [Rhizobium wenxiniae]|uniref:TIR domain-containing protein n=1 Tax=Rhizobium wenxiniae TaxID=1737357 RepID=UPI001C6F44A4|nr:TIR domain-containing protein [Rhizobium wenxiniae]MBW9090812.1 TIR domain-containing protein [Rhizobium wenxiniae]